MDEMQRRPARRRGGAAEFYTLATLFDFPDQVNKSNEMVKQMRNDLCLTKKLWDLTNVVQTTLDRVEDDAVERHQRRA